MEAQSHSTSKMSWARAHICDPPIYTSCQGNWEPHLEGHLGKSEMESTPSNVTMQRS